jgi:hypothetical protein
VERSSGIMEPRVLVGSEVKVTHICVISSVVPPVRSLGRLSKWTFLILRGRKLKFSLLQICVFISEFHFTLLVLDKAFTPPLRQPSKALFCSKLLVLWTYGSIFFFPGQHTIITVRECCS